MEQSHSLRSTPLSRGPNQNFGWNAQAIVQAPNSVAAGKAAAMTAIRLLREAHQAGRLKIPPREIPWLDRIQKAVETIPANESEFIGEMMGAVDTARFVAGDYEL